MTPLPTAADLGLRERIGQVLCLGWQGESTAESHTVNRHARALVEEMHVGSVVLLGRNVDNAAPDQTRAMLAELQSLARIPLLIAVDQEGGRINRFGPPFTQFSGNMALGAIAGLKPDSDSLAYAESLAVRQAVAQARELLAVGVNWNFAPVVDVQSNPANPIIGVRSYGENPEIVARLGAATAAAFQSAGMLACAKHFPGHGDSSVDSHLAMPSVSRTRGQLDALELLPFRHLIEQGIAAIMTTHILFPVLDPDRPATISRQILTDLLRREFGFNGLIITDCLEMEAIAGTVGTARGAVAAIKAGADIVLISHTLGTQRAAFDAIQAAVESGELPESRLDEAVDRVLAAKRRFLTNPPPQDSPWLDLSHKALEEQIAWASVTVVKKNDVIPFRAQHKNSIASLRPRDPLLLISMHPAVKSLEPFVRQHHENVTAVHFGEGNDGEDLSLGNDDTALQSAYAAVIVLTYPAPSHLQNRQTNLVRMLRSLFEKELVVVAIREPYDLAAFPNVPNYLCTYGNQECSLEALADSLFGEFEPTGRLPITIPA